MQQLILNCCSVGFSVFYRLYNKRKLRGTNEMTSEWNYKNLNSARNGPSDEERGETDVFAGYSYRLSEDIDRQHNWSAFSLSRLKFFLFNSTCALFSDSNFKISTRVFFSFVNIYFANLDSYFLLHSMYFTSFDLRIMFSTCFYYRYNFVRNGAPYFPRYFFPQTESLFTG